MEQERGLPAEELAEYEYKFNKARRRLIRHRVMALVEEIDALTLALGARTDRSNEPIVGSDGTDFVRRSQSLSV